MSEKKPRDIYIEFGGDPSDDKELYKRYSSTSPFEPSSYSDEVIHCREVIEDEPDYKALAQELAEALEELLENELSTGFEGNLYFDNASEALAKYRTAVGAKDE